MFRPHSDSLLLAAQLGREPRLPGATVLDLCTGSGLLAIEAARRGAREVTAIDVSRRAVLATRLNARLNGVSVRALRGDLFTPVAGRRFDLIISNPPYLPSEGAELPDRGAARAWEGGPDGRAFIDRICRQAQAHVTPGGVLLLLQSSLSADLATARELGSRGFEVTVAARHHGRLGARGRARARTLRDRGLLNGEDAEEIVILRARRAAR
ncbi:MAG: methyltransferase [Actinobacteria bacterium]|nr:MAG: methyltransferase [Actinomycetota bacterium]